jgi:hypothetical protein
MPFFSTSNLRKVACREAWPLADAIVQNDTLRRKSYDWAMISLADVITNQNDSANEMQQSKPGTGGSNSSNERERRSNNGEWGTQNFMARKCNKDKWARRAKFYLHLGARRVFFCARQSNFRCVIARKRNCVPFKTKTA